MCRIVFVCTRRHMAESIFIHAASSAGMVESPDWSVLASTFFIRAYFETLNFADNSPPRPFEGHVHECCILGLNF